MKKNTRMLLYISLFLMSCNSTTISSIQSSLSESDSSLSSIINSESQTSDSSSSVDSSSSISSLSSLDDDQTTFQEALDNTKTNYSFISTDYQVDNLSPSQTHYSYKGVFYDGEDKIMQSEHLTVFSDSRDAFNSALENPDNYYRNVYYYDENDKIQCRYKNLDSVWQQSQYSSSYQDVMTTKMLDYIDPNHFYQGQDGYFYLNNDLLDTEEASYLAGYYGSFAYLYQNYEYIAFSIKDNHFDKYKIKVHFTHREGNSFEYDAINVVEGEFFDVGNTIVTIPDLPVYAEDLLVPNEIFDKAVVEAKDNYTYDEKVTIIDESGNEVVRTYQEQVMKDAFHYYGYFDSIDCYYDDYVYKIYKESFSGGKYVTSYETLLIYYEDYTDYQSYDMDIEDDTLSKVENIGGQFGTKIYEYVENGNYYTPINAKPEKYNPKDYTYLDYACLGFIHGLYGNYTASDGTTYQYTFNTLKFYLNENNQLYRVNYDYILNITKNNITNEYHYVGNGSFSNIGTTSFSVPSDPNEDITIDSRLEGALASISTTNYTYEETYFITDENGERLNQSLEEGVTSDTSYFKESVDGQYVFNEYSVNAIVSYDNDDNPVYKYCRLKDYYYFGEEKCLNYYEVGDFFNHTQMINGTYKYSGIAENYQSYLKFFKYVNTKTVNGQEIHNFRLTSSYLKLYGKELIASVSSNQNASITSLNLQVSNNQIVKVTYVYDYYDVDNNYIGECEGTITFSNFNSTNIEIPNFDESICNNTVFEDTLDYLSSNSHFVITSGEASYYRFGYSTSCKYTNYGSFKISNSTEDTFYYDEEGNLYLKLVIDEKVYSFMVIPFANDDLSFINRDDFIVDSNGYYFLDSEKFDEYMNLLFTFPDDVEIRPTQLFIEVKSNLVDIHFAYHLRYKLSDNSYAIIYVSGKVTLTTNYIKI